MPGFVATGCRSINSRSTCSTVLFAIAVAQWLVFDWAAAGLTHFGDELFEALSRPKTILRRVKQLFFASV